MSWFYQKKCLLKKSKLSWIIWMTLKSSVLIFQSLEHLQPQWPEQPLFIKNFTDPDSWIIPGTQMTNTGHFLWNGSSEFHFVIDIVYPFCRRMLRPMLPVWLRDTEKVMVHLMPKLKSKSWIDFTVFVNKTVEMQFLLFKTPL